MSKVLQATCINGKFIPDETPDSALEGKRVTLMIFDIETEDLAQHQAETDDLENVRTQKFLEHTKQYSFQLPPDYKFDRNEIYDR
ncbi:MAG: hypothetical protein KME11_06185 [Timaviella obliquedivisa GSE-PSE-MK23-08B]|jgi:hypothetical protein|nr:hypothetical protein [Timaviella obliquedivisa GSE-PSE-MK23-08B]